MSIPTPRAPRRSQSCARFAAFLVTALLAIPCADARQPAPRQPAQAAEQGRAAPPPVLLGARADLVRTRLKVRPSVVIVRSTEDYARMIARWSLAERFPVLIDDGTDRSREDIARFVRSFQPETVMRWSAADDADAPKLAPFPEDRDGRIEVIDAAWRRAWNAGSAAELDAIWKQTQFLFPGVVVASTADPAWTAALALAAGHGQPIIWVEAASASASAVTSEEALGALDAAIQSGIEALKPAEGWRGLGDQIDAITLCLSVGARIGAKGELALTDRIGRFADEERYAWTGMIFGDEARSAYMAMCSLFLQPAGAWVFDGYKPDFAPPFQLGQAAELLDKAGLRVSTNLPPKGAVEDWRERTRFGITAEYIHVNSSGLARFFDLNPGRAYPSDVPPLNRPAIVHFIHSFSAEQIGDANTVGGRWMEHGAFAYLGAMHEPFLGAFLPGHMVVARLLARAPWGAAVRQDGGKLWKLNVFGDPLFTIGAPAPRHDEPLALKGAVPLDEEMRSTLKARNLTGGVSALIMLGQDDTAVRIAQAALAPDSGAMTPDLARIALPAALRERNAELFLTLFAQMSAKDQREPLLADMLWRVARPMIDSADAALVERLRNTIRVTSIVEDAKALAPALTRLQGARAAKSLFAELVSQTPDTKARQELIEAGNSY